MKHELKILIIDDSEDDRYLYRRTLQKSSNFHYDISEATTGEKGLALIESTPVDCVLLDYSLPGRNGVEVLKTIRAKDLFMPVVILTGQGNEAVAVSAIQEGAQNYISKSRITFEALQNVIQSAVERCALEKRIHDQRTSLEIFTRALAHDLKEPVRTIQSFINLITKYKDSPDKIEDFHQHIHAAADRMALLIETVFLYTQLDGPEKIIKENCDMNLIFEEAKHNLIQLIDEYDASIVSEKLPHIHANRTQLLQVMQNLLANAIHHSDRSVEIRVGAEERGENWVFSVRDNGPGISAEYLEKIFIPFKKLGDQKKGGGAGLGLAICRKIIEAHDGKITCESTPGLGANFLFSLPKSQESSKSLQMTAPLTKPIQPALEAGNQLANVLLVDDSASDILLMRLMLGEGKGVCCHLLIARDGQQALDTLRAEIKNSVPIDLLILDINMPKLDGFEVLEEIRKDEKLKHLSVVMCTGSTYDKDRQQAESLGAIDYIVKPPSFPQLKSVIEKVPTIQIEQQEKGCVLRRAAVGGGLSRNTAYS